MTKRKNWQAAISNDDGLAVYTCWFCSGEKRCSRCQNTRRLIYVNGYTFPYTSDGEKRAKAERAKADSPKILSKSILPDFESLRHDISDEDYARSEKAIARKRDAAEGFPDD